VWDVWVAVAAIKAARNKSFNAATRHGERSVSAACAALVAATFSRERLAAWIALRRTATQWGNLSSKGAQLVGERGGRFADSKRRDTRKFVADASSTRAMFEALMRST